VIYSGNFFIITTIVQTEILLLLLFSRILFATAVLSILIMLIMFVRKNNLAPNIRSFLWALCIPVLFIPFERSAVILMQGQVFNIGNCSAISRQDVGNINGLWPFCSMPWDLVFISVVYIWLLGFIFYVIRIYNEHRKTMNLLKAGEIKGCAAYYYKFRSHIYTPPNFNDSYTINERAMLLAHEQQHIKQYDPLLFLILQGLQCVFWFNPLVHKAVQCIRHDRELLCDQCVASCYSSYDYGKLLLNEAQKAMPNYNVVGISSSKAGIYERIVACTRPFSKNKKATVAVAFIAAFLFLVGSIGFTRPIVYHPMETMVVCASHTHVEGFDKFITQYQGNIIISEELYDYATASGFEAGDNLSLVVFQVRRPSVFNTSSLSRGFPFVIGDLEKGELIIPYYEVEHSLHSLWGVLYRML